MQYAFPIRSSVLFAFSILMVACSATEDTMNKEKGENGSAPVIVLGKGGGFTGEYKEYVIQRDGKVYQRTPGDTTTKKFLRELDEETHQRILDEASALGFPSKTFDHPGNMTYYIRIKREEKVQRIKWGSSKVPPPEGFKEFFDATLKVIRK